MKMSQKVLLKILYVAFIWNLFFLTSNAFATSTLLEGVKLETGYQRFYEEGESSILTEDYRAYDLEFDASCPRFEPYGYDWIVARDIYANTYNDTYLASSFSPFQIRRCGYESFGTEGTAFELTYGNGCSTCNLYRTSPWWYGTTCTDSSQNYIEIYAGTNRTDDTMISDSCLESCASSQGGSTFVYCSEEWHIRYLYRQCVGSVPVDYRVEDYQSAYTFKLDCKGRQRPVALLVEGSLSMGSASSYPSEKDFLMNEVFPTNIAPVYTDYGYRFGTPGCPISYGILSNKVRWLIPITARCGETVTLTPSVASGYGRSTLSLVKAISECEDRDGDNYFGITASCPYGTDCNDDDPTVYPGAKEICDGKDNNCDGQIDEGFVDDEDGDGYTTCGGDCNDNDPLVYPDNGGCCPIPHLTPLTDPLAIRMEGGDTVILEGLTPETQQAVDCFQNAAIRVGGTLTITSAYRPPQYQQHLREVWDRYRDLARRPLDPACNTLREEITAEFQRHQLRYRPAVTSRHSQGIAIDAAISPETLDEDTLANNCNLYRPLPNDPVHFELRR